jgi:hypothetical protein
MRFKRFHQLFFIYLVILLAASPVFGSTTGKIVGRAMNSETDEPLIGVNVMIEGSSLGASTDINGRFIIVNIPPGYYTVRADMMGYQSMRVQNVGVSVDLTTNQDFYLKETVLKTEAVVITAERPLVQKDMTSSMAAVRGEEISEMPVQSLDAVVNMQAGVVNHDGLHIRGGRSGEVVQWVDGLDMTTVGGNRAVTIEKDMVQELQVISGTFNAEYGRAMSGVVNVITKEGSNKYQGSLKTYGTGYYSRFSKYYLLDSYENIYNEETGQWDEVEQRWYYYREPNIRNFHLEGQLSGSVPFTGNKIHFISNLRFNNDFGRYGVNWFQPNGLPGDSSRVRYQEGISWSGLAKLSGQITQSVKASYSLYFSGHDGHDNNSAGSDYVPFSGNQSNGYDMTHMLSINHVLSPTTFYELKIARNYGEWNSYLYEDYTKTPGYLVMTYVDPAVYLNAPFEIPAMLADLVENGGGPFVFDENTAEGQDLLDFLIVYQMPFTRVIDPDNPDGYVHPNINNPDSAPYSLRRQGMSHTHTYNKDGFISAKLDISSQINKTNYVKAGADIKSYTMDRHSFTLIPAVVEGTNVQIVPFEPAIPDESTRSFTQYHREPYDISAYIQDKIEFKEIILNVGLRYDYFNSNSVVPADPRDPDIYFPFNNANIYKNWIEPTEEETKYWSILDWDNYKTQFEEYTPDERRAFMHKKATAKQHVSPRLGVSFPFTDKGVIHFSYGHFFQRPSFGQIFAEADFKIGRQQLANIGNADLDAERTIQYEVGIQQQLSQNIGADMTVFYKDIRGWISSSTLIETDDIFLRYAKRINKDFANVRGITLKLEKRFANDYGLRVDYTYQIAEGINNAPEDAYQALTENRQPRNYLIPMGYDLRHNLYTTFRFKKWGWLASFIWNFRTGFPYTPSAAKGETVGGSAFIGWRANSGQRPIINDITMRLEREFRTGSFGHLFFIYVYNLFDWKGETDVYSDTGTARYTTYLNADQIQYDPDRIGTIGYYIDQNNTWMYQSARRLEIGYMFKF